MEGQVEGEKGYAQGGSSSPPPLKDAAKGKASSITRYLATRVPTLKPPMAKAPNPFKLLALLNVQQWLFFLVAFCGWTWDAFDFFTVSLTVSDLAKSFNKSKADITWGITLVLMLRSVGSIAFGLAADRYGRKWPFIINNILFIALELGTGFTQTYKQFLAVRALFGIAMGGLYGNAAATALEDCPEAARGIISGMLQQGYAFGYLLATVFSRAFVNTTSHGWRPLFWFGAGPPVLIILFRLCLPETRSYRERHQVRHEKGNIGKTFISEGRVALKRHWLLLIYLVLLMAGFNFMSHGSQDLYPTMLTNQYNFSANAVTVTQVVANLGAMAGGTTIGYSSQIFGRRFSIIFICVIGGALLYPYTFVSNKGVIAAAFFQQFCVQGAWGVIPIHLMELSPGSFRTFVVGTSYQLGNLVSSASSTIEATIGERFPLPSKGSETRYQYGKVICIFMGCVYAYTIILTFLGPEKLGRKMSAEYDNDLAEAAGRVNVDNALRAHGLAGATLAAGAGGAGSDGGSGFGAGRHLEDGLGVGSPAPLAAPGARAGTDLDDDGIGQEDEKDVKLSGQAVHRENV
ncbi:carboxylic acid transporter protein-like protein [Xylona heveae TC161]|uniref:Carboxylic acid transporter protein-like protein n=1 Tax=Xylona heveae (strain CBS 132557 / TC161) TaxID=1328760 RepID=A0A165HD03_XYLHT|nr:carboxylic acid transporter protein-like protein [Xylona heveae TC161]KZF23323.1 carboxylic acid transporter protein-like protein [Xylona heveae TC161]